MNVVAARVAGDSLKPRGVSPWLMQNGLFQAIVDSVSFCGARVDVRLCSATHCTGLIDPFIYFSTGLHPWLYAVALIRGLNIL